MRVQTPDPVVAMADNPVALRQRDTWSYLQHTVYLIVIGKGASHRWDRENKGGYCQLTKGASLLKFVQRSLLSLGCSVLFSLH